MSKGYRRPKWVHEYIGYMSNYDNNLTIVDIAKKLSIGRDTIYKYIQRHPEIEDIIASNLQKQENKLRIKALKSLYGRISKSDKALQMALEKTQEYIPRQDVTNRYENMREEEIVTDILNSLKKVNRESENAPVDKQTDDLEDKSGE